ncbi:MAG: ATP-binding protein [Deltaproteobacteria bacterium]|nr:ATP-binding protein [Deltaproteobacteria bacterium]
MYRKALKDLKQWAATERPKPLILRGARQVGKSYLAKLLADNMLLDLCTVNLEKTKLREVENQESFSIDRVISEISLVCKKKISDNSLIFLDEIQAQPAAINALRYFYEDRPGLRVIAAGSLFEVIISKQKVSIPVGRVEYYYLSPMTFFEFLQALDEEQLLSQLQHITLDSPPSKTLHEMATELLKEYYFVGGMPEAVATYVESKDREAVRKVHYSLVHTYREDITKYASGGLQNKILKVLEYVPANIGEKVIFSKISRQHSTDIKNAIALLAMANVIYRCCHNSCTGLPLSAGADCNILKLYFLDVGLYNSLTGLEWGDLFKLTPDNLLTKGNIAEQFAVQHLAFLTPTKEPSDLYYWLRGKKKGAAEVDFICSYKSKILPIEVKSGASGKMRSLWQLVYDKKIDSAIRLDLSLRKSLYSTVSHHIRTGDGLKSVKCNLIGLPIYLVENLFAILGGANDALAKKSI